MIRESEDQSSTVGQSSTEPGHHASTASPDRNFVIGLSGSWSIIMFRKSVHRLVGFRSGLLMMLFGSSCSSTTTSVCWIRLPIAHAVLCFFFGPKHRLRLRCLTIYEGKVIRQAIASGFSDSSPRIQPWPWNLHDFRIPSPGIQLSRRLLQEFQIPAPGTWLRDQLPYLEAQFQDI